MIVCHRCGTPGHPLNELIDISISRGRWAKAICESCNKMDKETSAIDPIFLEAQKILFYNRDAKYIILSIEAYQHLRARRDGFEDFMIDNKGKETFRGREIAFVYTEGIVIDVGGLKNEQRGI